MWRLAMRRNESIFSLVFALLLLLGVWPIEAAENSFDIIKITDIHEPQIPASISFGVIDSIDWRDFDKIVFSSTETQDGKFCYIYVCDSDGRNLQKLTDVNGLYPQARWIFNDKIAYIDGAKHKKIVVMDTNGNDVSGLLDENVRNICTNPYLLSSKYGYVQDLGDEISLFRGEKSEKRMPISEYNTHWLTGWGCLICDAGEYILCQDRPQYKRMLQRIDLKDGTIHDISIYEDPSAKTTQTFTFAKDGFLIAYISGREIWIMTASGANSQCIYSDKDKSPEYGAIAFSPKGDKIAFSYRDLKGDRKWRIWIAKLEKKSRPAKLFDKLEAVVISEVNNPIAIKTDDILSLNKEPDTRISIQEINLDIDTQKELMVILQRQEEKDIIILDYRNNQYIPIWTKRCFWNTEVQTLAINETDNINAVAVHTDSINHGRNDDCCIYNFTSGKAELIWRQMLTNIYNSGYQGKVMLDNGDGYKNLIAMIEVCHFGEDLTNPVDEPRETLFLRYTYTWDGNQYIGDEIEKRVNSITQ
jgi:hypothetical protein